MEDFYLQFRNGEITGHGRDIIGPFAFHGEYGESTGELEMTKKYLGRHEVKYRGRPDGEGCIIGTWTIAERIVDKEIVWTGPFLLQPVVERPSGGEPIVEIIR